MALPGCTVTGGAFIKYDAESRLTTVGGATSASFVYDGSLS